MSIFAANCPCCGRDIGFDENAKECTCIFCGAKLITATLVKERVDGEHANAGYEHYRKGDAQDTAFDNGWGYRPPVYGPATQQSGTSRPAANANGAQDTKEHKEASKPVEQEKSEPEKEPELTEEEVRIQLMRKAEFKQELRDVVKEIDTLRSRRERYSSQLKSSKLLMITGLVFIAFAALVMVLFDGGGEETKRFIIAGALCGLGLFMLILSEVRKNNAKKQQKNNEKLIVEKKEKRDVLIGRLNKINKHLHIHDDGK